MKGLVLHIKSSSMGIVATPFGVMDPIRFVLQERGEGGVCHAWGRGGASDTPNIS